ncbi:hypothetical protein CRYUN_Cryun25bG0037700 [Craigia yunnanensis]
MGKRKYRSHHKKDRLSSIVMVLISQNKRVIVSVVAKNNEGELMARMGRWLQNDKPEAVGRLAIKQGLLLIAEKGFQQRSANVDVYRIAQQIIKRICPLGWVIQPPSLFVYVLNNDGLMHHH